MRSFISESLAKYLYQTLLDPVFTYCDFIYDGCHQYDKDKLQIAQNNSLCAIKRCNYDYPTARLHDELKIEYLAHTRQKSTIKMTFRGIHDLGPPKMNDLFEIYKPARSLRSEDKMLLLPPRTETKITENDMAVRGCYYWSFLDEKYKQHTSIDKFKLALKPYGTLNSNSNAVNIA